MNSGDRVCFWTVESTLDKGTVVGPAGEGQTFVDLDDAPGLKAVNDGDLITLVDTVVAFEGIPHLGVC